MWVTDAAASDLVSRNTIQAPSNEHTTTTAAEVIRTALWFRAIPATDRSSEL